MAKLHLNWDGNQSNGIIFNERYDWGALFVGIKLKPKLSVDYYMVQYSEVFPDNYIIYKKGDNRQPLPDKLKDELKKLAIGWIQPPDQEGGVEWKKQQEMIRQQHQEFIDEFNEFLATKGKTVVYTNHGAIIGDL